jgi:hypothetical protein
MGETIHSRDIEAWYNQPHNIRYSCEIDQPYVFKVLEYGRN